MNEPTAVLTPEQLNAWQQRLQQSTQEFEEYKRQLEAWKDKQRAGLAEGFATLVNDQQALEKEKEKVARGLVYVGIYRATAAALDQEKGNLAREQKAFADECRRAHEEKNALNEEKKALAQDRAALAEKKKALFQQEQLAQRKVEDEEAAFRERLKHEHAKHQEELRRERKQAQKEIADDRRKALAELDEEFQQRREANARAVRAEEEQLRARVDAQARQWQSDLEEELRQRREAHRVAIEGDWNRLRAQQQEHQALVGAFAAETARAEQGCAEREALCRRGEQEVKLEKAELEDDRQNLEALVRRRAGAELQNLRDAAAQAEKNRMYLLDQVAQLEQRLLAREEQGRRFGEDYTPERIKQLLDARNDLTGQVEKLTAQLHRYPTEQELEQLRADARQLRDTINERDQLKFKVQSLTRDLHRQLIAVNDLEDLRNDCGRLTDQNKRLRDELQALRDLNGKKQEREARVGQLLQPRFSIARPAAPEKVTEMEWLERVFTGIRNVGFEFPRRLLYAFHTSLKIAEWSPLTVLAGVSGTGKSELPRLYALCGGLQFEAVAVQPNWDSPQDLFGFFNYMDNCFNPKPLLQGLVQSQRPKDKGGFDDGLLLVLLDEMNLARVELYFSDLLSLLELRRGVKHRPTELQIDLGSGLPKEPVPLGRNVLFVGTMNEDETTHALSDKALDRSNVLGFPRPVSLRSRDSLELPPQRAFLERAQWERWLKEPKATLGDPLREQFRRALEEINEHLASVRRALGHRVWQAMESYLANHPRVGAADAATRPAAARYAFEDQLVQKVMPKLRGVETTGTDRTKCLDRILQVVSKVAPGLEADFRMALESPDGSFTWHSKEYLKLES